MDLDPDLVIIGLQVVVLVVLSGPVQQVLLLKVLVVEVLMEQHHLELQVPMLVVVLVVLVIQC